MKKTLTIDLNFELTFGNVPAVNDFDIVVVNNLSEFSVGGVALPLSNGNPGKLVQLFFLNTLLNTDAAEHVITHEIGHTLGLRHTDWFDRNEAPGASEPAEPFGANHIPSTPTGFDPNSIMRACFNQNQVIGEFSNTDITALEYLY